MKGVNRAHPLSSRYFTISSDPQKAAMHKGAKPLREVRFTSTFCNFIVGTKSVVVVS
jgi:hypothetical protein